MRIKLLILHCLLVVTGASAQEIDQQRFIKLTYVSNQTYVEKAVQTIEAISRVPALATVDYQAGRSVLLKPGFVAESGAIFTAYIKPVDDASLRLAVFPNPVDHSATISFDLPKTGTITLVIVDIKGQIIGHLLENSIQEAGHHQVEWKAETIPAGIYMATLATDQQRINSRVVKK